MGKYDKLILGGISAVALVMMGIFFFMGQSPSESAYALISIDGENVMELDLKKEADRQIDLNEYGVNVILEVKEHKIQFLSSDCPDKVCIRFGLIDHDPQSAVCMPNRVAVTINSFSSGI